MNESKEMLGEYLKRHREAAGYSLRQLAPLVTAHNSLLGRIESGQVTQPSPELLQRLADVLEIDASELLAFVGVKPSLPQPTAYFRRTYGMSEADAQEAAQLIEDRYGKKPDNKTN